MPRCSKRSVQMLTDAWFESRFIPLSLFGGAMDTTFHPLEVSNIKEMFWRHAYNNEIYSCASEAMQRAVGFDSSKCRPWLVVKLEYQGRELVYAFSRNSSSCDLQRERSGEITNNRQLLHHKHIVGCCFLTKCGLINAASQGPRSDVRPIGNLSRLDVLTKDRGECQVSDGALAENFIKALNTTRGGGFLTRVDNYQKIGS